MIDQTVGFIYFKCGKRTILDIEDYKLYGKYSWFLNEAGYVFRNEMKNGVRRKVFLARKIMGSPAGMQVDHINKDKLDNRRSNLRIVTHRENSFGRKRKNKTSVYLGVSLRPNGKWHAQSVDETGKRKSLGCHEREVDAALAYDRYAIQQHGLVAKTNLLPPMPNDSKINFTPHLRNRRYSLRAYCIENNIKYHQALSNPGYYLSVCGVTHAKRFKRKEF